MGNDGERWFARNRRLVIIAVNQADELPVFSRASCDIAPVAIITWVDI